MKMLPDDWSELVEACVQEARRVVALQKARAPAAIERTGERPTPSENIRRGRRSN
jgi:hypothetical protein